MRRTFLLLAAALLSACSSVRSREFEIRAVNVDEQPVRCMVTVDGSESATTEQLVYTDTVVSVSFDGGQPVNVRVTAVPEHADRAPVTGSATASPYLSEYRDLFPSDPRVQLFILRRDPEYMGPISPAGRPDGTH